MPRGDFLTFSKPPLAKKSIVVVPKKCDVIPKSTSLKAMLSLPVKRRYSPRYDEYCIQCKQLDIKHRGNLHKAQAFKLLHDLIDRISRVFRHSAACDNQFAGTEHKNDHFRL